MAIRTKDDPKNQFPRNILRKNFGKAGNKEGFVVNSGVGAFMPWFGLGIATDEGGLGLINFFAFAGLSAMSAFHIAHHIDQNFDATPEYEVAGETQSDGLSVNAYHYDGKTYLLRHTEEGVQLFAQHGLDNSVSDDIFTLVSYEDAPAIAREIGTVYRGIVEQNSGVVDIWSEFEQVRAAEPEMVAYEGISYIYDDPNYDAFIIIGDNVDIEANAEWSATPATAEAGLADWQHALEDMAMGHYISEPEGTLDGLSLRDVNTDGFLTWLMLVGGSMGLGAAGGATYSIASSRRRFNKELGIK